MNVKRLFLFLVTILAIFAASAMNATAQGRYVDPNYPMDGVLNNNSDMLRDLHYRLEIGRYGYGRDLGLLAELMLRGRIARDHNYRRDNNCNRSYGCEESYLDRSSRQTRDRRYQEERTPVLQDHTITNLSGCDARVFLNGDLVPLQYLHRIHIKVFEGERFVITAYNGHTRLRIVQDDYGNFIIE